ncbi:MAG: ribonuclease III [Hyphomonadaceae bacterium]|nr:MAG: ribonuclease III [Hyphomonadaceae bacterium]
MKKKPDLCPPHLILELEKRISYVFKDKKHIGTALLHKSAGDGIANHNNNERLEWLGDRVLGLLAAQYLFDLDIKSDEGHLTKAFNQIVNGGNCAVATQNLGIDSLIVTSKSIQLDPNSAKSVHGDAFEAIIGALYLDGGLEACAGLFEAALAASKTTASASVNYKSLLQEWAQKRGLPPPIYTVMSREGPDHAPDFLVEVDVNSNKASARGRSKQIAERAAAQELYEIVSQNEK